MKITKIVHLDKRKKWREWLRKNHNKEKEIWFGFSSTIPYNDAVEEALCYGWIDSIVKTIDRESFAQRFSPRNLKSVMSEMNKERVRRLIKQGKMTKFGMERIKHHTNQ